MYLVRARSDLICAIKSRARHATRNAESFLFYKDNIREAHEQSADERNGKQFAATAFDISRESREFFSRQEDRQDRIPPNVERLRRTM